MAARRDLAESYLPAFEACVGAGARSVMCSYNRCAPTPPPTSFLTLRLKGCNVTACASHPDMLRAARKGMVCGAAGPSAPHCSSVCCRVAAAAPSCRVNGVPACANAFLLNETLRDTWGFTGFVTRCRESGPVILACCAGGAPGWEPAVWRLTC